MPVDLTEDKKELTRSVAVLRMTIEARFAPDTQVSFCLDRVECAHSALMAKVEQLTKEK